MTEPAEILHPLLLRKTWMTPKELAEFMGIHVITVYQKSKAGDIPRVPGISAVRFDPRVIYSLYCQAPLVPSSLTTRRISQAIRR